MKPLIIFALLMLLLPAAARAADCTGCIAGETWQEFGVSSFSDGFHGQWYINTNVAHGGALSTVSISNPPWKPVAGGTTQTYLSTASGVCTPPLNCGGAYIDLKSSHRYLSLAFYFKTESAFSAGGAQSFFLRWNNNNYDPLTTFVGTDFANMYFDNSGHLCTGASCSSAAISDTNWHVIEVCTDFGTGSNGKLYAHLDGSLVLSVTGATYTATSTNNITLDNEYGTTVFDFGPVLVADLGTCTSSTTITDGVHFYAGHYLPGSDVSIQFTRSTGSNSYANVNSTPAGSNYNFDATGGQSDLYGISIGGTIAGANVLAQFSSAQVEIAAAGDRVGLPISKVSGSTVNGTMFNLQAQYAAYYYMNSVIAGTVIPSAIGLTVNN